MFFMAALLGIASAGSAMAATGSHDADRDAPVRDHPEATGGQGGPVSQDLDPLLPDDTLLHGKDDDILIAGSGSDILFGGDNDRLTGGGRADLFVGGAFVTLGAPVVIADYDAEDDVIAYANADGSAAELSFELVGNDPASADAHIFDRGDLVMILLGVGTGFDPAEILSLHDLRPASP